jgi:hypothetical protein
MVSTRKAAALIAVLSLSVVGFGSPASAAVDPQCKKACETKYQQCLASGKSQEACTPGWFQCKKKCAPPAQSPAPKH